MFEGESVSPESRLYNVKYEDKKESWVAYYNRFYDEYETLDDVTEGR